jgi:hypothetical protein
MRCYLMKGGHIVSIRELPADLSDEEAVEQGRLAFEAGREHLDDFEVWQRTRRIYRQSLDPKPLASSSKRAVWP